MLLPPYPFPDDWPKVAAQGGEAFGSKWLVPGLSHSDDDERSRSRDVGRRYAAPRCEELDTEGTILSQDLNGDGCIVVTDEWRDLLVRAARKRATRQGEVSQVGHGNEVGFETGTDINEQGQEEHDLFVGEILLGPATSTARAAVPQTHNGKAKSDKNKFKQQQGSKRSKASAKSKKSNRIWKGKTAAVVDHYRRFQVNAYGDKSALTFATIEALLDARLEHACSTENVATFVI